MIIYAECLLSLCNSYDILAFGTRTRTVARYPLFVSME